MALEEHFVKPPAVVERLNLLGVAPRDGGDDVGVVDPRLHPVDVAPELESGRDEDAGALQARLVENGWIPASLILQVVDGVDDARSAAVHEIAVGRAQVGRRRRCLPVVEMDDVGREIERREHLQQAAAEDEKAPLLLAQILP